MMENQKKFLWERHPDIEEMFLQWVHRFVQQNKTLAAFEQKLITCTSTRLIDWIDHMLLVEGTQVKDRLHGLGFIRQVDTDFHAYYHPRVQLPRIVLTKESSALKKGLALRVENISDFLQTQGFYADIEGKTFSPYRRALVSSEKGIAFLVVERRGTREYRPAYHPSNEMVMHYLEAVELWKSRQRSAGNEENGLANTMKLAKNLASRLGPDLAAHVVCMCERDYWLSRNHAGRVQKMRQDRLGLGWANHDHHTFRSSRRNFTKLVELFTLLGFQKRERFYAGKEAGWGAQVMEHLTAGLVLFLDVDLAPEEVAVDFGEQDLEDKETLGTVGLWCALHGDSILEGGMHHLAANFDFERVTQDLSEMGIAFMDPFSNFPYIKQAFSKGEIWEVNSARVKTLLDSGNIDAEQAETFLTGGAVGSHLENIQRREGFKGFNQKNVNTIIKATDPRRQSA